MNSTDITNVVIIRFSVRFTSYQAFNIHKNEEERTSWFIFRAKFFNSYLYSCLQHQTKKPNKIYVLVDKGDRNLVEKYLNIDNITIIYCNNMMLNYKQSMVSDLCKNKLIKNLVISRIDSDDLIHKDYLHNINQQLLLHPKKKLVACSGYLSDLNIIQSIFYPKSPFISEYINFENNLTDYELVENLNSCSVYDICHTTDISFKERNQNHNAEWMQVVHHTNISNKLLTNPHTNIHFSPLVPIDKFWFNNWTGTNLLR